MPRMYSQCDSMDSLLIIFKRSILLNTVFPVSIFSTCFFLYHQLPKKSYCKPKFESDVASTRQDLTQVDRNLITIRELNYLLSDRMFARRCLGELHGESVFFGHCDSQKNMYCLIFVFFG